MRALAVGLLLATLPHSTTGRRKAKKAAKQQQQGAAPSTTHLLPFEELDGLPPPGAADRDTASRPRFLPELGLPSDFLSTSWDNEPRLIRLGPSAFRGMMDLSSGDLETLISSNSLRMGADAQFSQDGNKGAGTLPTLTLDEARWRLDDGASIMITALENFWPKCAPLVTATQRALRFYASINMYLTPPEVWQCPPACHVHSVCVGPPECIISSHCPTLQNFVGARIQRALRLRGRAHHPGPRLEALAAVGA
jgi:hypothetical protein